MGRFFLFLTTIIFLNSSSYAIAFGSKPPSGDACSSNLSSSRVDQLMSQYVPRGSNGRASAAAFYEINAQGYLKKTVYSKNVHVAQAVASIQKILTAYTAYRMGGLNNRVVWNSSDLNYDVQGGRAVLNSNGQTPSLGQSIVAHDLLKTLMTQSSNGAALALSRSSSHQSSRVFMNTLNQISEELLAGETNFKSYFQNPAGLTDYSDEYAFADDPNRTQESTADNMARLVGKIMNDGNFKKEMVRRGLPQFNTGWQMTKLGSTQAAGRTIIGFVPFPKCKSQGLSLAIFGETSSTQFDRMYQLINAIRADMGY